MSSAKKFKNHYPKDKPAAKEEANPRGKNREDKALIKRYVEEIHDLLERDEQARKKAARIVSDLINSNK